MPRKFWWVNNPDILEKMQPFLKLDIVPSSPSPELALVLPSTVNLTVDLQEALSENKFTLDTQNVTATGWITIYTCPDNYMSEVYYVYLSDDAGTYTFNTMRILDWSESDRYFELPTFTATSLYRAGFYLPPKMDSKDQFQIYINGHTAAGAGRFQLMVKETPINP